MCKIWITVSNNYQVFNTLSLSFSFCLYKTGSTHSEPWQPICSLTVMLLDFYTQMIGMLCVLCRWADTFCLHCNIFIYVRHIWIKLVLWSRMVSLLHHTSPWTHIWLQPSPSAHRNGRVFRHSVQTVCRLNRTSEPRKKFLQLKFTDKCMPFMVISVLMWVQQDAG